MGNQPVSSEGKGPRNSGRSQPPPPRKLRSLKDAVYIKAADAYKVWAAVKETERKSGMFASMFAQERIHLKALAPNTHPPVRILLKKNDQLIQKSVRVCVPKGFPPGQEFWVQLPGGNKIKVKVPPNAEAGTKVRVSYIDTKTDASGTRGQPINHGDCVTILGVHNGKLYHLCPHPKEKRGNQRMIWEADGGDSKSSPAKFRILSPNIQTIGNAPGGVPVPAPITDGSQAIFTLLTDPVLKLTLEDSYVSLTDGEKALEKFTLHLAPDAPSSSQSPPRAKSSASGRVGGGTQTTRGEGGMASANTGGLIGSMAASMVTALAREAQRNAQRSQNSGNSATEAAIVAAAASAMAPTIARAVDARYTNNPGQIFSDLRIVSRAVNSVSQVAAAGAVGAARGAASSTDSKDPNAALVRGLAAMALGSGGIFMQQVESNHPNVLRRGNMSSSGGRQGQSSRRGLDDRTISRFPTSTVPKGAPSQECCICMDDMTSGDTVRRLPCFHVFHDKCIDPWLKRDPSCPICKRDPTA
ncbi:hypothetical protein AAMO2058_000255600 [Amorphochlora amoebiformis]